MVCLAGVRHLLVVEPVDDERASSTGIVERKGMSAMGSMEAARKNWRRLDCGAFSRRMLWLHRRQILSRHLVRSTLVTAPLQ